jgi:hypothetical protein
MQSEGKVFMIRIDDDVPMPQDGWFSKPYPPSHCLDKCGSDEPCDKQRCPLPEVHDIANSPTIQTQQMGRIRRPFNPPQPGPNDCTFIGGPLNGKFGPIEGNAKIVEIEIYGADGSVSSVELYSLGDRPTPTFRYHVGTKSS